MAFAFIAATTEFPLFCILTSIWDCLPFCISPSNSCVVAGHLFKLQRFWGHRGKSLTVFLAEALTIFALGTGVGVAGKVMIWRERWFHSWRLDELLHGAMLYKMLAHYKPEKSDGKNSDPTHLLGPAAMPFTAVSEFTSCIPLWNTGLLLDHLCHFFSHGIISWTKRTRSKSSPRQPWPYRDWREAQERFLQKQRNGSPRRGINPGKRTCKWVEENKRIIRIPL